MSSKEIIDLILTAVTIITAIIALWQTQKQIRLSNKQNLFDKRLEMYSLIEDLIHLYKQHRNLLINSENPKENALLQDRLIVSCEPIFGFLTNVSYLADMVPAFHDPLIPAKQNVLLTKQEMLKKHSREVSILWEDSLGEIFSNFIYTYAEVLMKLYQQKVRLEKIQEFNETYKNQPKIQCDNAKVLKILKGNAEAIGLFQTIKKLDDTYKEIVDNKRVDELRRTLKLS